MVYDVVMSDQKYRQRGYQDHDRSEREKSRPGGESRAESPPGPRGRGLGMPTATVFRCAQCGTQNEIGLLTPVATCVKCRADLQTCKNCRHFDAGAHNECRQNVAIRIAVKTKRNECPSFEPRLTQEQQQEKGGQRDARSAFDALFKI